MLGEVFISTAACDEGGKRVRKVEIVGEGKARRGGEEVAGEEEADGIRREGMMECKAHGEAISSALAGVNATAEVGCAAWGVVGKRIILSVHFIIQTTYAGKWRESLVRSSSSIHPCPPFRQRRHDRRTRNRPHFPSQPDWTIPPKPHPVWSGAARPPVPPYSASRIE